MTMLIILAYLCVGIDTMDGLSGRIKCSSKEEGGRLSPSKNELDIIGEGAI